MMSVFWIWVYIGAFLMLLELLSPGFVMFFFGLSAATVGVVYEIVGEGFTLAWQLAAFSFFSVVYLMLLRRWMKRVFMGRTESTKVDFDDDYVGRVGKTVTAIEPPLEGRVAIGDAEWAAKASVAIAADKTVKVVGRENLTMIVEAV